MLWFTQSASFSKFYPFLFPFSFLAIKHVSYLLENYNY